MITLSMKSNIEAETRHLRATRQKIASATVQALNAAAFGVRQEWVRRMPITFDRPIAYTVRSPRYEKATATTLTSRVYIADTGQGTTPQQYLEKEAFGGQRPMKPSERMLGSYYVPGPGARLDKAGNINFNTLRAILAAIGGRGPAFPGRRKGGARANRRKQYFRLFEPHGRLPRGVYERTPSGIKLVMVFVDKPPSYKRRFDVQEFSQGIAVREFDRMFRQRLS